MNNNLPMIKKEGIFYKIKKWINKILGKEEIIIEPAQELTKQDIEKIKIDSFREGLKVKSKNVTTFLQKQLESEEIKISDLTEEQMDNMIDLYREQINEQDNKIRYYKNILSKKEI